MSIPNETGQTPKKKRGFATLDPERVREFARRGGVAAHRAGTAHEFSREEARIAGRKGGIAAHAKPLSGAGGGTENSPS